MAIGLRERKKTETRRAISDAALSLAIERGPANVTIEDIAAAADVAPRTVFNYFGTKDEAILDIDPQRRAELLERLATRPAEEAPFDALRAVLVARLTANDDVGRIWRARAKLVWEHPHLRAAQAASTYTWERELAATVAERCGLDVERHVYPLVAVRATLAAMHTALERTARSGQPTAKRLRRELDAAFDALADGLRPPEAS